MIEVRVAQALQSRQRSASRRWPIGLATIHRQANYCGCGGQVSVQFSESDNLDIEGEYRNAEIVWRLMTPTPIQGLAIDSIFSVRRIYTVLSMDWLATPARHLARLMQRSLSRGHVVTLINL